MPIAPSDFVTLEILGVSAVGRAHFRDIATDRSGNVLVSASAYAFVEGTGIDSVTPTGTAVTMYTSADGGTTTTNPMTTNSDGEIEFWTDLPGTLDIVYVTSAGLHVKEVIHALDRRTIRPGASSSPAALLTAIANTPGSGANSAMGQVFELAGGEAASPDSTDPTGGTYDLSTSSANQITPMEFALLIGRGADGDRSRASTKIKANFADAAVVLGARMVTFKDLGITNSHTSGKGIDTPDTNPGGGMQSGRFDRVHVFDVAGPEAIYIGTFNVDLLLGLQTVVDNNDLIGLHLGPDSSGNSPNAIMFIQSEFSQNNQNNVAGTPNIKLRVTDTGGDSGNLFTMLGWKAHGDSQRILIQGHHLILPWFGYIESNQGMEDNTPSMQVEIGAGGSTSKFWTMGFYPWFNRWHNLTKTTSANWNGPTPTGLLLNKLQDAWVLGNRFEGIDASTTTPLIRVGPDTRAVRLDLGAGVSNASDHSTLETDPQKLVYVVQRTVADGAMTSGDPTLDSATAAFVANDVGKVVFVTGAGASGKPLRSTIASVTNATSVELSDNAGTTATGATVYIEGVGSQGVTGSYFDSATGFTKEWGTFETIWVPASSMTATGGAAAAATLGTAPAAIQVIEFSNAAAATDNALFSVTLRKSYTERAVIYFTLHWASSTTPGASQSVNWIINALAVGDTVSVVGAGTTTSFTGMSRSFTTSQDNVETRMRAASLSSDANRIIRGAVARDAADSYNGVARLLGVLVEIVGPSI